jgi:hypothetical protein
MLLLVLFVVDCSYDFDADYTINGDRTITDELTGLVWQSCAAGQSGAACSGDPVRLNWQEAID